MANPWSIPAMGWVLSVVGWLLSPVVRFYLQKLTDYLIFDARKELLELKNYTVPALKAALRDVEEQRMVRAARDESRSDLGRLDDIYVDLKSALCQAEGILDLVEYLRIEKDVTVDGGSWGVQQLIHAAGSSIGSWVQRCIDITPAPLLQFVQSMRQKLRQLFGGISLWSSGALLPISQATSTVGVQRICGWCRQLVANITSCCRSLLSWCTQRIADARYYRDWSYGQVGIKSGLQKDGDDPVTTRIRLRKQIKGIEDILTSSKMSNLLNQSSSRTTKDDDKESSRNCTVKESSSKQKEIDKSYINIDQEVFGRIEHRVHVCKMLREGPQTYEVSPRTSKPYCVIGIYGITGSGKSTLAQYVCNYEKDAGHFNPIMFILVGKAFSVGDIIRDMLDQIKQQQASDDKDPNEREKTEFKDLESLQAELKEKLRDKRFLLVLDDLWVSGDKWKDHGILLDVLNAGQSGSRILVTAQKKDAAAALGAPEQMQILIPDLEEKHYLSMFMHYALEGSQVPSTNYETYETIGRKITKKLCGSPIAARTVAARLRSNNSIRFWKTTANLDVLNKTMHGSSVVELSAAW